MKLLIHLSLAMLATVSFAQPTIKRAPAEYGRRIRYVDGALDYPEFSVRFLKREEYRPPGTRLLAVTYRFAVIGKKEDKIAGFAFIMSGTYENTRVFEVGGKMFVAEMFYSTGGQPVPPEVSPKPGGSMHEEEIVIWDEPTARSGNPQLLELWKKKEANQTPEPTAPSGRGSSLTFGKRKNKMRTPRRFIVLALLGLTTSALFVGCESVAKSEAERAMRKKNEQDLKAGRQSPKDYRDRRDEIDRNLR